MNICVISSRARKNVHSRYVCSHEGLSFAGSCILFTINSQGLSIIVQEHLNKTGHGKLSISKFHPDVASTSDSTTTQLT
ncbi:5855_t:CDS:1, partial [Ambispora leptoticha]